MLSSLRCAAPVLFMVALAVVGCQQPRRIPVILETDIGGDIDDTWALAFLLASPKLHLKLVVTDSHNARGKARIAAKFLERAGRTVTLEGLRPEFSSLLGMIAARAEETGVAQPVRYGELERLGRRFAGHMQQASLMLAFIGEAALAALRVMKQPSRMRVRPVLHNIQSAGFEALPIVGLLSFLMGVVVSYQGAEQLARYGASIFVADLVGLSMLREMAPLLTAIIPHYGEDTEALEQTMFDVAPTVLFVMPKYLRKL